MKLMRDRQRGSTLVEFTLVGIPLLFVFISVFEMSRGMWIYHTLAYAVKEGTRYAAVHGANCGNSPNSCTIAVRDVVGKIRDSGVGLPPGALNVTLTTQSGAQVVCSPISASCLANASQWPPSSNGDNQVGKQITITATCPFRSALALFWPGAGKVSFGAYTFPASSTELMEF
jgi:Flp pilus assembly protein TadG